MHIGKLDMNLLRVFDAVYRTGSVSRASDDLGLSQPATSQAISRLRLVLKDALFVRVQGGVAYWEGATGVVQHKGAATRMAKSSGAKRVVNNIKISDEAKEKAADNLEQGRRRAQVKRSDPRSE